MSERQFKISIPEGNGYSDPRAMKRVVDHLRQLQIAAELESSNDVPIKAADDTYKMTTKDACAATWAPKILESHYGLLVSPL